MQQDYSELPYEEYQKAPFTFWQKNAIWIIGAAFFTAIIGGGYLVYTAL